MTDTLELRLLAPADPARALDPQPDEDLLERLLATPRPTAVARPRMRPFVPALSLAAVATAAGVAALVTSAGGPSLDLAAKAYAATGVPPGQIVHLVATTDRSETSSNGVTHATGRIEEWHRGSLTHRIETFTKGGTQVVVDDVLGADGLIRETEDGSTRTVQAADPQHAAGDVAGVQDGFVEAFRRRYEQGRLSEAGDVQFAGRPAVRYLVTGPGTGPEQAFYVDRETGDPLGYTSNEQLEITDRTGTTTQATLRFVETVQTIEGLAPTPAHERDLAPPTP